MTKKKKIDALQEQLPTNNKWVLVYKCPISFSSGKLTLRWKFHTDSEFPMELSSNT